MHFAELRVQLGQLGAGLGDLLGACAGQQQVVTALGGGNTFVERLGLRHRKVAVARRDGFLGEQFFRTFCVRFCEIQLRQLRFPLGFGRRDFLFARPGFGFGQLRSHLIAMCAEFRRVEFNYRLAGFQRLAFLREKLFDPSAVAGSHVRLVGLNRARDG